VVEADPLETAFRAGAVAALRRRAARQAELAAAGTTASERGAVIRTGEAVLAARLSSVLSQIAAEFEGASP
jgi:hypothetical protein